ncbi:MAG: hypothetical protein M1617_02865 [Actinobacteria bacterium]|nr:hypothetical protein [Actinomycetota bacterium]MCL5887228.1 hypothetical protein [Actinomycetota bacterium]
MRYAVRLLGVIALQAAFFLVAILVVIPALPQTAEAIRAVVIVTGYLLPLAPGLLVPREWTARRRLIVSGASTAVLASILNVEAPAIGLSAEVGLLFFAVQVFLSSLISLFPEKSTQPQTT